MKNRTVKCCEHGTQGIGLLCVHAAISIDSDALSGMFFSDNTDLARPDAWCRSCEERLVREGWSEQWFEAADFKFLCAACWDLASERLKSSPTKGELDD